MVEKLGREEVTPARFREFIGGMCKVLAATGREACTQILQERDQPRACIKLDGQRLRYRGMSESEWLSPFGKLTILRRTYRGEGRGAPSTIPLELRDKLQLDPRGVENAVRSMRRYRRSLSPAPGITREDLPWVGLKLVGAYGLVVVIGSVATWMMGPWVDLLEWTQVVAAAVAVIVSLLLKVWLLFGGRVHRWATRADSG